LENDQLRAGLLKPSALLAFTLNFASNDTVKLKRERLGFGLAPGDTRPKVAFYLWESNKYGVFVGAKL
jgi:hypothetical protein